MALAAFFDKTALAMAEVLQGADYDGLARRLDEEVAALTFDGSAAAGEGRVTLDLALNLFARLYPRLALDPLDSEAATLADAIRSDACAISPDITWERPAAASRRLVVGTAVPAGDAPAVFVGSSGWQACVQRDGPVGSGRSPHPFAAALAACLGASVVFRDVFADGLPADQPAGPLSWSLLPSDGSALADIDLGDVYLAGIGAIGNAAVWALARAPGINGTLHLVDPEAVTLGNLQRYVLARQSDVGRLKVEVARGALAGTGIRVTAHPVTWGEAVAAARHRVGPVAVALDSDDGRREVQAGLPRWIVNAWTQPGDLGVSRHAFLGDQACLMCLYLPTGARPSEDELVAEALGLPDARLEIRQLLQSGRPVGRALLERVAGARQIPAEPLLAFEGRPLREFYSEGVCGGLLLRLGGETTLPRAAAAPLAHQSALAGILLAAELVLKCAGLNTAPPPVTTRYDVRRPFAAPVSLPAGKDPAGRCICQDPDYVAAYRDKHGE